MCDDNDLIFTCFLVKLKKVLSNVPVSALILSGFCNPQPSASQISEQCSAVAGMVVDMLVNGFVNERFESKFNIYVFV
jgi:hypothetical protein